MMRTPSELDAGTKAEHAKIHCWDPQSRTMVCGAPGQIGSTKHVRAVTCSTCLDRLGEPSRSLLSVVPR